uniref:ADAM metallopeptidase domain 32 n=1 Tax=Sarcophilus harrisii TaxID=9305 RepID=A0A7N4P964_SARHA
MFYLLALFAGLNELLILGLDFQQSFVEITVPEEILSNSSDSDLEYEGISYTISIEGRLYTLHLTKRLFLPDDFVVYMYNREGALYSSSKTTMKYCNYQGYVAGFPNSVVTLHACSGLRGLLQFQNVTYGIEPLGSAGGFQHLIYRLRSENTDLAVLAENNTHLESEDLEYRIESSGEIRSFGPKLSPQYVEIHIVLDKGLFDYMGSDIEAVTNKVIQILGLINAMFTQFKMTVVLSSLELWTYKNKISTTGEPDEILQRFLEWKNSYLVLRPYDMAYLFVYREHSTSIGATFPGKMCILHYAAGIVLVCGFSKCCNPSYCRRNYFAQCISGVCCQPDCKFNKGNLCRPAYDELCDFPEKCNGSSSECSKDLKARDGSLCADGTSLCFGGMCQNPDNRCQRIYGRGSKNGPFACYEEINSQQDRFGNCGRQGENRFKFCNWRNLLCGKLICTYPYRKPYVRENVAVIYSFVLNTVCISLDHKFKLNTPDPMLIGNGSPCDVKKFCFNSECVYLSRLVGEATACSETQCSGHGACTNEADLCMCHLGYFSPNCSVRRSRVIKDFVKWLREHVLYDYRAAEHPKKNWLLISFYISLPIFFIVAIVILKWKSLKECLLPEESPITESGSESTYSYSSSSEHST